VFKRKTKRAEQAKPADEDKAMAAAEVQPPARSPEQIEAEKAIARGERLKRLSQEVAMWRGFASGCKPGRWIMETHNSAYGGLSCGTAAPLQAYLDEDTALLWSAFAERMACDRERRMRDVLGGC
jgi:hypothetical protein